MQISPTRVLFYTDIDDSLIGWAKYNEKADELGLERTRDVLERHPEVACVPSTSRGLSETQRLAPMLKGYPLQMVCVNNGQQLFLNDTARPAEEWLLSLTPDQADPRWAREVAARSGGWEVDRVIGTMKTLLLEQGFTEAPPMPAPLDTLENYVRGDVLISHYPDQPSFAVRDTQGRMPTDAQKAAGAELIRGLKERLGFPLESRDFPYPGEQQVYLLEPRNVTKVNLLEHLVGRFPSFRAVVTAGDNTNDTMLYPDEYDSVPNYRIVAGDRLRDKMKDEPRVALTESGNLGPPLESHLATIESADTWRLAC